MLGQDDRGGGGPAARATEGNTGPAWFPSHPQGVSRASEYFEDSAQRVFSSLRLQPAKACLHSLHAGVVHPESSPLFY